MTTRYQDKLVEITDREVVFRRYYFPFCTAKRVPLEQIVRIERRPPSLQNGSWRIWGSGNFSVWFPLDSRRPRRDAIFLATLRDASMRIGFTVEDSEAASGVLSELGVLDDFSS